MMACFIFASCVWIMRSLSPHSEDASPSPRARLVAGILLAMTFFQIYLGALVAGLDAGFSYNTWPLMDGALVPQGLFVQAPAWINLFENPKTVQFIHRIGAYLLFAIALAHIDPVSARGAAVHPCPSQRSALRARLRTGNGWHCDARDPGASACRSDASGHGLDRARLRGGHLRGFYGERARPIAVEVRD